MRLCMSGQGRYIELGNVSLSSKVTYVYLSNVFALIFVLTVIIICIF